MAFDGKSRRTQLVQLSGTSLNVENFATGAAVKMVMMSQAGSLVARGLARNIDRRQPAFFDQRFDVAINRSDTKARDFVLGVL